MLPIICTHEKKSIQIIIKYNINHTVKHIDIVENSKILAMLNCD